MKNVIFLLAFLFPALNQSCAQNREPLVGNSIPKTSTVSLTDFDRLEVLWLGGKIDVEFGAAVSDITIATDQNIFDLLDIDNTGGGLRIAVRGNKNNRLWLEDDKTRIKIRSRLQPSQIVYQSNGFCAIHGINSTDLRLEKGANGALELSGTTQKIDLDQSGNGALLAKDLKIEVAKIALNGNGNAEINAKRVTNQQITGNGGLHNIGDAILVENPQKKVRVTFVNPSKKYRDYDVRGLNDFGRPFSYGLGLEPAERVTESLPIGTKIYRNGKLIVTIQAENDNSELIL